MRPMDVSMTTVGPLGRIMAAAVAWGASGRSSAGLAGAVCVVGVWVLACCAVACAAKAAVRPEIRSACESVMPCLRVNHGAGGLPEACCDDVSYRNDGYPDSI